MTRPPGGGLPLMRLYLKPMLPAWTAQSLQRFNTFTTNYTHTNGTFLMSHILGTSVAFVILQLTNNYYKCYKILRRQLEVEIYIYSAGSSQLILSMRIVVSTKIRTHNLLTWILRPTLYTLFGENYKLNYNSVHR